MRDQPPQSTSQRRELDGFTKWALAVLIIVAVVCVSYTIIHSVTSVESARAQLVASLPPNYRDTVKAMLTAADAQCSDVCDLTAARASDDRFVFRASCGVKSADRCATERVYMLTIEPAPTPSR